MEAINWHSFFFLLAALTSCVFGVAVVLSSNIVRMAFYLVLSLAASAGLHFLAGADFVGAMQILIYVGGTLVLLVFGVMLTAQQRFITMKTRGGEWILAAIVGGSLLAILLQTAFGVADWMGPEEQVIVTEPTATRIGLSLLGVNVDDPDAPDSSGYLLPFEIVSVHLLVVLIGAAYLARAKRRVSRSRNESDADGEPAQPSSSS